jgi:carbonic anhydrase/acetyltransferase-like protein (isoleucine patch superfamily)
MFQSFRGMVPVVHASSYVHPLACVIGHVTIGPKCYIGAGAVLRGDWGRIVLEAGCNVQENCTLHLFPNGEVYLEEGAHIGHGAIIHGARIGRQCLVGMNSVIMDDVVLGAESIVGALSFVPAGSTWAPRSLLVGNPAQRRGEVTDAQIEHKIEGTRLYQELPAHMHASGQTCSPDSTIPEDRIAVFPSYATWQARKRQKTGEPNDDQSAES